MSINDGLSFTLTNVTNIFYVYNVNCQFTEIYTKIIVKGPDFSNITEEILDVVEKYLAGKTNIILLSHHNNRSAAWFSSFQRLGFVCEFGNSTMAKPTT